MTPEKALQSNPFYTYRDPQTGQWLTVVPRSEWKIPPTYKRPLDVIRLVDEPADCKWDVQSA